MSNGQSATLELNNEQVQVLLTGRFGDGCLCKSTGNKEYHYYTNCIYEEYLQFKSSLLGNLVSDAGIKSSTNRGFKDNVIYKFATHSSPLITSIAELSIEEALNLMDELGLALLIYDDGSLHKDKLFYNINTQAYSKEVNSNLIAPFLFKKFNIKAIPTTERKKDGREYCYLRVGKWDGSEIITNILGKYFVPCYNYKLWSSETIQKWSKLQEKLKSEGTDYRKIHPRTLTTMLSKISV